jgi:hypothetical protein
MKQHGITMIVAVKEVLDAFTNMDW